MEKPNTKDAMMRPLTFPGVNTLLDFKKHSLKEHLDHIFNGPMDSPLILGSDTSRIQTSVGNFSQYIYLDETHFVKAKSTIQSTFREFNILGNRIYYHRSTFKEILNLNNISAKFKINKKGESRIVRKEYRFDNRLIEIDYDSRTYKSICYGTHLYSQRIMKNGLREYSILFPYTGCELYEYYNSKGVCTNSIFNFPYESSTATIQVNLNDGVVDFFCKGERKAGYMLKTIKLMDLKDASIVNLYNENNCFYIDLMIPNQELYDTFQFGLQELRTLVQERSETALYDKTVFKNMLQQIQDNTKTYET